MAAPPRPIPFLRIWAAAPLQLAWSVTELRGRRRRPPDRASMMMAFGRVLAPRSGLARSCSLSLSAWLPSAAPDHGRAAAADFFFANLGGGAAAAGLVGDGATGSTATTAGSRQHDDGLRTCARSKNSGLARWCSLSLSAWLPSAAPDHGRAAAADFFFANLGGGAAAAGLVGDGATGSTATTAGSRQHDDGLRTCARSKIPGWRVGALYPLARGCRAPRRIMAAPPRPISFLRIWVAAPLQLAWSVTELRGRRRRPPDRASMMMAFGRVLAPKFRAGALVLFIP